MRDEALDTLLGPPKRREIAFDAVMPNRVSNILLVSSLYDSYTLIEDGRLGELLFADYLELGLRLIPSVRRVSTAEEALAKLEAEPCDLVISMPRVGEMDVRDFGRAVRKKAPGLPVVLLAGNTRELNHIESLGTLPGIERVFVWLGDGRVFLAIVKLVEDRLNAAHDAREAGVKSILLVEDSIQFYSSYLPMLYTEIVKQTQALMADSANRVERSMRRRARPKILLATTYEEALELYGQYENDLLGVILDAAFPVRGEVDPEAGPQFVRMMRARTPDLPVLMQSNFQKTPAAAAEGVVFVDKNSPSLLGELREFMQTHLGFGEFVFRQPDQTVVTRVPDLRSLEWAIEVIPRASLLHHLERSDISTWLKARTEFELAETFRMMKPSAGEDPEAIRARLLRALAAHRERARAGIVADFSGRTFEGTSGFVRIGTGSLGGKGRGLAFINAVLTTYPVQERFPGVRIFVPATAILATGVFDQFMESSGLLSQVLQEPDDEKITRAFLKAELPEEVIEQLWTFLDWVRYPLAVRSSSLLEDASYQPFAGIYKTFMIPNNHEDPEVRLAELCNAIKMVYASTYHSDPKAYMDSVPNRMEEEKMAVVIQQVVGKRHGDYVYPHFAGVGRSLNFYPMPGMNPEDGIVSVALGVGKTVVDGGKCFRFCPAHPLKPLQSFTPEDHLENSQRTFLALDLSKREALHDGVGLSDAGLVALDLQEAERHGTLAPVGSVYSPENDAVYAGVGRAGVRLVTMAGVLKHKLFPLGEVTSFLLKVGAAGASCPVEIEFAVNLSEQTGEPHEFAFLQIRPLVLGSDMREIAFDVIDPADALVMTQQALGNGLLDNVSDVIAVKMTHFDRSKTPQIASEIGAINASLKQERRPYLVIGPGRWGSADPWLGIPVRWAQISGVACIVETGLADIRVDPSQGSHFFQNLMSFGIGYLTLDRLDKENVLDLDWLESQEAAQETEHLRHLRFSQPLMIALDGRRGAGVVMKPGKTVRSTQ
ncbi:MAG: PEP/pyruvate-binding domain-containing protein [Planctomycetota bacterium]